MVTSSSTHNALIILSMDYAGQYEFKQQKFNNYPFRTNRSFVFVERYSPFIYTTNYFEGSDPDLERIDMYQDYWYSKGLKRLQRNFFTIENRSLAEFKIKRLIETEGKIDFSAAYWNKNSHLSDLEKQQLRLIYVPAFRFTNVRKGWTRFIIESRNDNLFFTYWRKQKRKGKKGIYQKWEEITLNLWDWKFEKLQEAIESFRLKRGK